MALTRLPLALALRAEALSARLRRLQNPPSNAEVALTTGAATAGHRLGAGVTCCSTTPLFLAEQNDETSMWAVQ